MKSERTKLCKKRKWLFFALSTIFWVGAALFAIISVLAKLPNMGSGGGSYIQITDQGKAVVITLSTTGSIILVLTMFIKEKARVALWMISMVICLIIYKEAGAYAILACWFVEDTIFHNLYLYYKEKLSINKEIDLRQ